MSFKITALAALAYPVATKALEYASDFVTGFFEAEDLQTTTNRTLAKGLGAVARYRAPQIASGVVAGVSKAKDIKERRKKETNLYTEKGLNKAQNFGLRAGSQIVKNELNKKPYMFHRDATDMINEVGSAYSGAEGLSKLMKLGLPKDVPSRTGGKLQDLGTYLYSLAPESFKANAADSSDVLKGAKPNISNLWQLNTIK